MSEDEYRGQQQQHILTMVREGMPVYDLAGEEVGRVDMVYLGTVDEAQDQDVREEQGDSLDPVRPVATSLTDQPGEDMLVNPTGEFLGSDVGLPESHRSQMLRQGFIRIEGNDSSQPERYALAGHIASVSDENVELHISEEELLRN